MIPSITCYIPPSVERLGPRPTNFSNPDPRPPQISNQIDAPACYPQHPPPDPYSTGINLLFHCPCLGPCFTAIQNHWEDLCLYSSYFCQSAHLFILPYFSIACRSAKRYSSPYLFFLPSLLSFGLTESKNLSPPLFRPHPSQSSSIPLFF